MPIIFIYLAEINPLFKKRFVSLIYKNKSLLMFNKHFRHNYCCRMVVLRRVCLILGMMYYYRQPQHYSSFIPNV